MVKQMDVTLFEQAHPNLKEIYHDYSVMGDTQVFVDIDGTYYVKGPFARWEAFCYTELGKDEKQVQKWIVDFERLNNISPNKSNEKAQKETA